MSASGATARNSTVPDGWTVIALAVRAGACAAAAFVAILGPGIG